MKKVKHYISLSPEERRICLIAMFNFRNYAIERDIDTVDIDKLIKMLSK